MEYVVQCRDGGYYALDIHGVRFAVEVSDDSSTRPPWEECDGHAAVVRPAGGRHDSKHPGERRLGENYFYDWAGAIKQAKREGWGVSPNKRPLNWELMSTGQRTELAVQHDFDFLLGWVEDEWHYVCVGTALWPPDAEIEEVEFDYCGGIETFNDHHEEYALDACIELLRNSTDVRLAAAYAVYLQENQK